MSATLNDMTPEALRDLMLRASATADGKEMAQKQIEKLRKEREADAEAKRKAEKDIIPPAGTFWRYNKRVWTVVPYETARILMSADLDGGDVRYWCYYGIKTFSGIRNSVVLELLDMGGHPLSELKKSISRKDDKIHSAVGRLVLTARDIK